MGEQLFLLDLFYYFAATALFVPIFKYLGLGSVLGYLTAGILMGPHGLGLLHHVQNISEISQIGIIMLMFVIGLELTPARLSHLKRTILGEGVTQYLMTSLLFAFSFKIYGWSWTLSFLVAASLSLSSTAFSLTWLKENECLTKSYGQSSIGILIFQDLIIIPLLTVIPFLSPEGGGSSFSFSTLGIKILMITGAVFCTRYALLPILNKIYDTQVKEIFIAGCLMFVIGASLLMGYMGLSKALGAFAAGIFLSSSRLKSEIQSFSLPIKSMAMGFFFMGFGLSLDFTFFRENITTILFLTGILLSLKAIILMGQGLVVHRKAKAAASLALILCQGGEFGLLAIGHLMNYSLLAPEIGQILLSTITLSIFVGPFMGKVILFFESRSKKPEIFILPTDYIDNDQEEDRDQDHNHQKAA
jgi:monovalent cation:proton antiporter-2 (CPA2) family protein